MVPLSANPGYASCFAFLSIPARFAQSRRGPSAGKTSCLPFHNTELHRQGVTLSTVLGGLLIRTPPIAGYIALPNLPPRAALLTAPNLRTAVLTQAVKNPTRRMIPMTMATMPSMMMTTTMRIATTATRTTQQA